MAICILKQQRRCFIKQLTLFYSLRHHCTGVGQLIMYKKNVSTTLLDAYLLVLKNKTKRITCAWGDQWHCFTFCSQPWHYAWFVRVYTVLSQYTHTHTYTHRRKTTTAPPFHNMRKQAFGCLLIFATRFPWKQHSVPVCTGDNPRALIQSFLALSSPRSLFPPF